MADRIQWHAVRKAGTTTTELDPLPSPTTGDVVAADAPNAYASAVKSHLTLDVAPTLLTPLSTSAVEQPTAIRDMVMAQGDELLKESRRPQVENAVQASTPEGITACMLSLTPIARPDGSINWCGIFCLFFALAGVLFAAGKQYNSIFINTVLGPTVNRTQPDTEAEASWIVTPQQLQRFPSDAAFRTVNIIFTMGKVLMGMTFASIGVVSYKRTAGPLDHHCTITAPSPHILPQRTAAEVFCGSAVDIQAAENAWSLLHRILPRAGLIWGLVSLVYGGFAIPFFHFGTAGLAISEFSAGLSLTFSIYLLFVLLAALLVEVNGHVYSVRCFGHIAKSGGITCGAVRRHYSLLCVSLRQVSELWGPPLFLMILTLISFGLKSVLNVLLIVEHAARIYDAFQACLVAVGLLLLISKLSQVEREHRHLMALLLHQCDDYEDHITPAMTFEKSYIIGQMASGEFDNRINPGCFTAGPIKFTAKNYAIVAKLLPTAAAALFTYVGITS